jgi:hypothetical protein
VTIFGGRLTHGMRANLSVKLFESSHTASPHRGQDSNLRDLRVMSLILRSAGLRGAQFQAVSARSNYVENGWNLWGMLPHLLPQRSATD